VRIVQRRLALIEVHSGSNSSTNCFAKQKVRFDASTLWLNMDEKLPREIDNEFIRLRNFGGLSALRFIDGGEAVVDMEMPELSRLIEVLLELEQNSVDPDQETVAALKTLKSKYAITDESRCIQIEVIVPIAKHGVNLEPILDSRDPLVLEWQRLQERRRQRARELGDSPT
jgi:hypothetical protein